MSAETVGSFALDASDLADARSVLDGLRKEFERSGSGLPKWLSALCGVVDLIWRGQQHSALAGCAPSEGPPQPVTLEQFNELAAMVGDIANTLGRERVVERLSQLEAMTLGKRIDGLRARLDGQRIAGDDLASRVAALEKLTDLEAWRELAAAHVVAAQTLRARIAKLGSGTGGAP